MCIVGWGKAIGEILEVNNFTIGSDPSAAQLGELAYV
jgi:hypothetical protein